MKFTCFVISKDRFLGKINQLFDESVSVIQKKTACVLNTVIIQNYHDEKHFKSVSAEMLFFPQFQRMVGSKTSCVVYLKVQNCNIILLHNIEIVFFFLVFRNRTKLQFYVLEVGTSLRIVSMQINTELCINYVMSKQKLVQKTTNFYFCLLLFTFVTKYNITTSNLLQYVTQ